jgi:glycosyltransferase involved in cell wall biosynthesis
VGYSGNLGRAHDWQTLFGAAQRLRDREDILFLVCGGGRGYEQLHAAVEDAGMERSFRFLAYQPQGRLAAALRVADLHWLSLKPSLTPFIFPSKFYGIVEAGRPMVFVGEVRSAMARLLAAEGIGVAVNPGDEGSMAAAVEAYHQAPERCHSAGNKAQVYASRFCGRDVAVAAWHAELVLLKS